MGLCIKLTKDSCNLLVNTLKFTEQTGDLFPAIASAAGGSKLKKAVTVTIYVTAYLGNVARLLIVATILQSMVFMDNVSELNQIRLWTVICVTVSFPIMCLENLSNLTSSALIAVMTSSIGLCCILVDTVIAKFTFHSPAKPLKMDRMTSENIFECFGTIAFSTAGCAFVLPSMYVFVKKPDKLNLVVIWTSGLTLTTYIIAGIVPYVVFGKSTRPSITTTLKLFFDDHLPHPVFQAMLLISQLVMAVHFILVNVLSTQPLFQNLERFFKVPKGNFPCFLICFTRICSFF